MADAAPDGEVSAMRSAWSQIHTYSHSLPYKALKEPTLRYCNGRNDWWWGCTYHLGEEVVSDGHSTHSIALQIGHLLLQGPAATSHVKSIVKSRSHVMCLPISSPLVKSPSLQCERHPSLYGRCRCTVQQARDKGATCISQH